MPKLLIVTTVASTLRAFLLPYAEHFKRKGWTVDAMSNGVSGCVECQKAFGRCHEISFSRNPLSAKNFGRVNAQIREIVTEGEYDIVHVHTPVASFVTRLALRKFKRVRTPGASRPAIVYTAHGFHFYPDGFFLKNALFAALERLAGEWTDRTITINPEDYEAALILKIATKERLSLLPGIGLDFQRYSPRAVNVADVKKLHGDLKLEQGDELFLMAAEFIPRKRHKDALHALAKVGRKDFHLAFAGSGPLEEPMKRLAVKLGVESRAHFLGERSDVPLLMLSSRATILPSIHEGLSRSVMESICLGIPVLGADVRGIRELVTTPSRGALFPLGNSAALAAEMILAVEEPNGAKPTPDPLWNIDHLLAEHEKIYLPFISGKD
ncbi:MAG: glycosyltransferase [Synergistaceae bacterium]|jgi:glycosyltransferase involved in cell wall biosynthesis|nr:glycosyltransferase [Synergistaceae bacterium]